MIAYLFRFVRSFCLQKSSSFDAGDILFRLTLEYARLMNTDRESMTFMDAKDW